MTVTSQILADNLIENSSENPISQTNLSVAIDTIDSRTLYHPKKLLLTIMVNEELLPDIYYAEEFEDESVLLNSEVWKLMNLITPKEKFVMEDGGIGYKLHKSIDIDWVLNQAQQTLKIKASVKAFHLNIFEYDHYGKSFKNDTPIGAYINYSATTTLANQQDQNYGAFVEGVGFNHYGTVLTSVFSSKTSGQSNTIRAESYFQKDMPENLETLVLGDTIGSAGAWSRPVRFGGIRWSTDFSLRQGFVSFPTPSITGSAALPSTVDVLINNQRRTTDTVNPGPFEIKNFPTVTGSGEINLIVKDLLGVETLITQSYYSTPRLLKKDLHDFSFETGFLRKNYGIDSNSYDSPFISATYRRGFDHFITLEGRSEIQKERQALGIEVSGLIANFAVTHLAVAHSSTSDLSGNHYVFGIERSAQKINANFQYEYFDHDFVQFAALPSEKLPQQKILMGFGANIYKNVWLGTNYTSQTSWDAAKFSLASASMSVPIYNKAVLNTYLSKQFAENQSISLGLNIIIPFDNTKSIKGETRQDNTGQVFSNIEMNESKPAGSGFGYRARLSDDPNQQMQAAIYGNTSVNSYVAEVNKGEKDTALRLSTEGSIGMFAGLPFMTRTIGHGSFGVVKIANQADVDVYNNNQKIATTNTDGLALIPNLVPYQSNRISINPSALPLDLEINETRKISTPYAKSGVLVNFEIRRTKNILIKLIQKNKIPVPQGAIVHVSPSRKEFYVAKRGEVYLTDMENENKIDVEWSSGSCSFTYVLPNQEYKEPIKDYVECDHE